MNYFPNIVNKYLSKYSFSTWKLESQPLNKITNAIVVPVISEYENLRNLLSSLIQNDDEYFDKTAVIIVVNNFPDSFNEIKTNNQMTLKFIRKIIQKENDDDMLAEGIIKSKLSMCLVDASSEGLEMPAKIGGVGLARKIGMDEALKVFDYNTDSKKIIICLDADCFTDPNYLTAIVDQFNKRKLSASVVNFQHILENNSPTTPAIICYEIFLHYYVLGLKYANSPFAFHTIGSTIICDYESYIKVEGMNKKKAAEDFYFLEKLAKNCKIEKINSTTVYPSARSSWRVPFGTGQRVERFLSHKQNEYLLHDPRSFDVLKQWLIIFNSRHIESSTDYLKFAKEIHPELSNFLTKQNFKNDWDRILENSTTFEQLTKQKLKWFDGFKTLKLIHHLRDTVFPQVDMFEALNGVFERIEIKKEFFWLERDTPNLDVQKEYLGLLREIT